MAGTRPVHVELMAPVGQYAEETFIYDPHALEMNSQTLPLQFGDVHYVSTQRNLPQAIIFLHGIGSSWITWTPMLKECVQLSGFDIAAIDLPGFAGSQGKLAEIGVSGFCDSIMQLCRMRQWGAVHLVGHSLGGWLSLDLAAMHPEKIVSVGVISASYLSLRDLARHPVRNSVRHGNLTKLYFGMRVLSLVARKNPTMGRWLASIASGPGIVELLFARPDELPRSIAEGLAASAGNLSQLNAIADIGAWDDISRWAKIECPVISVFGRKDSLIPAEDVERFASMVDASVYSIQDCGHFGHIEWPKMCTSLLTAKFESEGRGK